MSKIYRYPTPIIGTSGVAPNPKYAVFGDDFNTITQPGYLTQGSIDLESYPISTNDIVQAFYNYDQYTQSGDYGEFTVSMASSGVATLVPVATAGTGTVNPGSAKQLSYYASTGDTVSGLTGANNASLITGNSGDPTWLPLGSNQVALGRSGAAPFAATLTAGSNVTIASDANAGTVTISATGGSGSGTVNSGSQNQLSYYAANGTAVSGLATANNGVLVTNGSGVPSISSTLPNMNIGTPSAGVLTNCTGLPVGSISGAGNSSVIVTNSSGVASGVGPLADGQLIIGSSGNTPVAATLTAGTNITITNAAGAITINSTASGGGMSWSNVTGTSQAMAVNTGYIANNAGLVTFTLPSTAAVGSIVAIQGAGAGGWSISLSGQTVVLNSGSASTSVSSSQQYDVIYLMCIVADTTWAYNSGFGNYNLA